MVQFISNKQNDIQMRLKRYLLVHSPSQGTAEIMNSWNRSSNMRLLVRIVLLPSGVFMVIKTKGKDRYHGLRIQYLIRLNWS